MYNTVYDTNRIETLFRTTSGGIWLTGYKDKPDRVHVAGAEYKSNTPVTGAVWCHFRKGALLSEYYAGDKLYPHYLMCCEGYYNQQLMYMGSHSTDILVNIPSPDGLSGIIAVDERFLLLSRSEHKEAASAVMGAVMAGQQFIHKRTPILGYSASAPKGWGWLLWNPKEGEFVVVEGDEVSLTLCVENGTCTGVSENADIIAVGIEDGYWKVTVPADALEYTTYVTKADVTKCEGCGLVTTGLDPWNDIRTDLLQCLTDDNAMDDIVYLMSELLERYPEIRDSRKDYMLRGLLDKFVDGGM